MAPRPPKAPAKGPAARQVAAGAADRASTVPASSSRALTGSATNSPPRFSSPPLDGMRLRSGVFNASGPREVASWLHAAIDELLKPPTTGDEAAEPSDNEPVEAKTGELASLRKKLTEHQERIESLAKDKAELKTKRVKLEEYSLELWRDKGRLQRESLRAQEEKNKLGEENSELREKSTKAATEMEYYMAKAGELRFLHSDAVEKLKRANEDLEAQRALNTELQNKLDAREDQEDRRELGEVEGEVEDEVKEASEEQHTESAGLRTGVGEAEAELRADIQRLKAELDDAKKQLEKQATRNEELVSKLNSANKDFGAWIKRIAVLSRKLENANQNREAERKAGEKLCSDLRRQLGRANDKLRSAERGLHEERSAGKELAGKLERAETSVELLRLQEARTAFESRKHRTALAAAFKLLPSLADQTALRALLLKTDRHLRATVTDPREAAALRAEPPPPPVRAVPGTIVPEDEDEKKEEEKKKKEKPPPLPEKKPPPLLEKKPTPVPQKKPTFLLPKTRPEARERKPTLKDTKRPRPPQLPLSPVSPAEKRPRTSPEPPPIKREASPPPEKKPRLVVQLGQRSDDANRRPAPEDSRPSGG